jgi:ribosomal protein L29
MKIVELREKTIDELRIIADDLKVQIHQKKMDIATNKAVDHGMIVKNKKELARVLTVINEKINAV